MVCGWFCAGFTRCFRVGGVCSHCVVIWMDCGLRIGCRLDAGSVVGGFGDFVGSVPSEGFWVPLGDPFWVWHG